MNDHELDAALRAAVRYDPARAAGVLQDAGPTLLEDIMHTPNTFQPFEDSGPAGSPEVDLLPRPPSRTSPGSGRRSGLVVVGVAAAVAVAVAVPTYVFGTGHDAPRRQPAVVAPAAAPKTAGSASQAAYVVFDQKGWQVEYVYQDAAQEWETTLTRGTVSLEISATPSSTASIPSPKPDPSATWTPTAVPVLGTTGQLDREGATDWAVDIGTHRGETLRVRANVARQSFLNLLADLRWADQATFDATMPASVVTPPREVPVAQEMLSDVPLPPGIQPIDLARGFTNDRYQYATHVTGTVACRWIQLDLQARKDGDKKGQRQADDAMASSHHWSVLQEIKTQGGWSQVVWEYADALTKGTNVPGGGEGLTVAGTYKAALGCN